MAMQQGLDENMLNSSRKCALKDVYKRQVQRYDFVVWYYINNSSTRRLLMKVRLVSSVLNLSIIKNSIIIKHWRMSHDLVAVGTLLPDIHQ